MTRGRAGRRPVNDDLAPRRRHRRGGRPRARAAHGHVRLRPDAVRRSCGGSGSPRSGRPRCAELPPFAGDELDPARSRRRPLRPGLRRRPAGRVPRGPQPGPDRPRRRGDALVAARLRPHVLDEPRPGHAAQPDGLQGRHEQPQARGRPGAGRARVGRRARSARLDARRHVPRHPPHPDADRGLGPGEPRRPGADDRPPQGQRRAARRHGRVRPGRPDAAARRTPVIPVDAHIRLAAPSENGGRRILRRGYSFTDGMDDELGQLDAGLFFISFQRDPARVRRAPAAARPNDALNEYIKHTGSALFACPPGAREDGYVGERCSGSSQARG